MFELIIGDGKPLQNASVPIRWCVSKDIIDMLAEKEALNPHVLIVATQRQYEYRELVPLDQIMTFFNIQRPGVSAISATIVWPVYNVKRLRNLYLGREYREYSRSITEPNSEGRYIIDLDELIGGNHIGQYDSQIIDVPKELFASYPDWFINLVNIWQESSVDDQCHFRNRVMVFFAFKIWLVVPSALLLSTMSSIVYLFLTIGGFYKLNPTPILHPFETYRSSSKGWIKDVERWDSENIFFKQRDNKLWDTITDLMSPYVWGSTLALIILVNHLTVEYNVVDLGLDIDYTYAIYIFVAYVGLFMYLDYVRPIFKKWDPYIKAFITFRNVDDVRRGKTYDPFKPVINAFKSLYDRYIAHIEDKQRERLIEMQNDNPLECRLSKDTTMLADIYDIPEKDRTIKLKVLAFKNKICKPLVQSR